MKPRIAVMTQNFYALVSPSQCSHHLWEFVVCEDAFKNKTTQKKTTPNPRIYPPLGPLQRAQPDSSCSLRS